MLAALADHGRTGRCCAASPTALATRRSNADRDRLVERDRRAAAADPMRTLHVHRLPSVCDAHRERRSGHQSVPAGRRSQRPPRSRSCWVASRARSIRASAVCLRIPLVAWIDEAACIGCTKCIQACPVDAIVGASRFMHTVIAARVHRLRAVHSALPCRLHRDAARDGGADADRPTCRVNAPDVRGGLRLDAHKERSTRSRCGAASIGRNSSSCRSISMPARPQCRSSSRVERVLRGQPIAEPGGAISAWLHAPASGTVAAIEPRPAPHRLGAPALSIVDRERRPRRALDAAAPTTFEQLPPEQLREHHRPRRHRRARRRGISDGREARSAAASERLAPAAQRRRVRALHQLRRHADARASARCRVRRARPAARARRRRRCIDRNRGRHAAGGRSAREAAIADAHDERIQLATSCRASIRPAASGSSSRRSSASKFRPAGCPRTSASSARTSGRQRPSRTGFATAQPLTSRIVTVTGDGVRRAAQSRSARSARRSRR